jgi:hypothetical protein
MQTYVEYTSEATKNPEWRLRVPDGANSFFFFIEHDEDASDEAILEKMFALCNHGSGKEHPHFLVTRIPSLSVNDVAQIGKGNEKRFYRCMPFGWEKIK